MDEYGQLKLNPNLRPPGGFRFVDADKVLHVANDLPGLIRALQGYRQRVGRAPGDPESEVLQQICTKHPKVCIGYPPKFDPANLVAQVGMRASMCLTNRVDFSATPAPLVAERARVCGNCRMRVRWTDQCKPCQKNIGAVVERVTAGADHKIPAMQGEACVAGLCDLQIATLSPVNKRPLNAPEHCWMGRDNRKV